MVITFVSNYINHHQIPFCEAMKELIGDSFHFVQTMPMEEERIKMGWAVDPKDYSYVELFYEDKEKCSSLIMDSDVVILGWTEGLISELEEKRLSSGKLTFRLSERIYREGQWKAISPKGLIRKYHEHYKYRKMPVYLLCAGAYVASDFELIRSYPDKKLKWGYFPDRKMDISEKRPVEGRKIKLSWTGRLIKLKHPEFAVEIAKLLKEKGYDFELTFVGDGNQREALEKKTKEYGLGEQVSFKGNLDPADAFKAMAEADIQLFTSNYLEGWGAVVNEAMQCGNAVVASYEAGAVPFLIQDGVNGLSYKNGDYSEFAKKVLYLFERKDKILQFGSNAKKTIEEVWNAKNAAKELLRFSNEFLEGRKPSFSPEGPVSKAEIIKPAGIKRCLQEDNHLE